MALGAAGPWAQIRRHEGEDVIIYGLPHGSWLLLALALGLTVMVTRLKGGVSLFLVALIAELVALAIHVITSDVFLIEPGPYEIIVRWGAYVSLVAPVLLMLVACFPSRIPPGPLPTEPLPTEPLDVDAHYQRIR